MSWLKRRLVTIVLVFFAALAINYAIPRLMPGNPVDMLTGGVKVTREAREQMIARFGLDKPQWEQFLKYLGNTLKGDFGVSFFYYPTPVFGIVMESLPWTLIIVIPSIILQAVIGFILGVTAGWRVGKKIDTFLQTFSLGILSTPMFWIAMVFLFVFSFQLDWFPLSGGFDEGTDFSNNFEFICDVAWHAALPIISFTVSLYAIYQTVMRNTMATTLKEQYILTALAKGLSENRVKYRHAARNSLLPMITMVGMSMVLSIGTSIYIEKIFSYPGIGRLLYDSTVARDYPVIQGCFLMFTIIIIVSNFIVDIIYMYLDPRVKY